MSRRTLLLVTIVAVLVPPVWGRSGSDELACFVSHDFELLLGPLAKPGSPDGTRLDEKQKELSANYGDPEGILGRRGRGLALRRSRFRDDRHQAGTTQRSVPSRFASRPRRERSRAEGRKGARS